MNLNANDPQALQEYLEGLEQLDPTDRILLSSICLLSGSSYGSSAWYAGRLLVTILEKQYPLFQGDHSRKRPGGHSRRDAVYLAGKVNTDNQDWKVHLQGLIKPPSDRLEPIWIDPAQNPQDLSPERQVALNRAQLATATVVCARVSRSEGLQVGTCMELEAARELGLPGLVWWAEEEGRVPTWLHQPHLHLVPSLEQMAAEVGLLLRGVP